MTRIEVAFTRFIRSRGAAAIITVISVAMIVHAFSTGMPPIAAGSHTFAFLAPDTWISSGVLSLWVSIAFLAVSAAMMVLLNRSYNLLRTGSVFFAAYFLLTTASIPTVTECFSAASLLTPALISATWLLFGIYNVRASSRRVFLIFFIIGAGILVDYTFALFIPVFMTGLAQMKIFKFKKLLAAFIGLITPAWIVWGLGILGRPSFPTFYFTPPTSLLDDESLRPLLASAGLTLLTGLITGLLNLIKIMGLNARARAFNGFLSILSIATGMSAIINFSNIAFYLPLLNACVSFQIGHFFRFNVLKHGYILPIILMLSYMAIYFYALLV